MSEQTGSDDSKPVQPPRFGEFPTGDPHPPSPPPGEQTGPPTEPRPAVPPPPTPPPPAAPGPPSAPAADHTVHVPASAPPPGGQPPNGGPPNYGGGPGGVPPGSSGGDGKRKGTIITVLVALGVVIAGTIGFIITRPDDNEPPSGNDTTTSSPEVTTTEPGTTLPETTTTDSTPETSTSIGVASGSVDAVFVRVDARSEIIPDSDLDVTLERIGLASGDNPASTAEPVLNLCAALAIEEPVGARVEWRRDNLTILENPTRRMEPPADGACINNDGEPLENGVYEVFFTDDAGGQSRVALFTVGASTRTQVFLNDTGTDVCFIDLAPVEAGFYQSFEPIGDPPELADGDTITIDIADVEHDLSAVDCDGNEFDAVFFLPTDDPVSVTTGQSGPPTTLPPEQISDDELSLVEGVIGSFGESVDPGSPEEVALVDELASPGPPLPIASEDRSVTLCSAWFVSGPFVGDAVWEFNGEFFNREPVDVADGIASSCIPPNGVAEFGEGAYQVYLDRDGATSTVQTYTVGRAQTQLGFENDTGVEICAVGFSPTLTGFYTFYFFEDSDDFDAALLPGESFTIFAPFIENDIQARDCDDNIVAENLDIPPTDQTLSLSTGQP